MTDASDTISNTPSHDPARRTMLAGLGGTLSWMAFGGTSALAQEDKDQQGGAYTEEGFNAYFRQQGFENDELNSGEPWIAPQMGNFDVNDPYGNRLARMKMTSNLSGARTYVPMMVTFTIGRPQEPGARILGGAAMFTWQSQKPDPEEFPNAPSDSIIMRSLYTAVYLDPKTMEPVKRLENPLNGVMMELEDYMFFENFLFFAKGGSQLLEELEFANDPADKPKLDLIKKWGDDAMLFQGGVYGKPGIHQPRHTDVRWRCNWDDLMDPDKDLIESSFQISGVNKAYEKPWMGYDMDDPELLFPTSVGKKVHSIEDIPDFHKRVLVEKYPERV